VGWRSGFAYGAGGKTLPKAGRLGTGAFYPSGHHASMNGNVFGPNWDTPDRGGATTSTPVFGASANYQALASTTAVGRNPADATTQQFPRNTAYQTASYNKLSPLASGQGLNSTSPRPTPTVMQLPLHERTTFVHGNVTVKRPPYRPSGGVNSALPSDTAFKRRPPKHIQKAPAVSARDTSLAGGRNFTFAMGNQKTLPSGHRVSLQQPTLIGNVTAQPASGQSRWNTVKRGAAG